MIILLLKNSMIYWWNSMTFPWQHWIFYDFPGVENSFLKFHDIPECAGTTLHSRQSRLHQLPLEIILHGSHSNYKENFRTFHHHKHQKIMTYCFTINDLLHSFYKKTRCRKCYLKHFCSVIIIINAEKLNCKNYLTIWLGFQEHISEIQDFFSTSVQFQDFSGPEKSKLKFQYFSGLVGTVILAPPYTSTTT